VCLDVLGGRVVKGVAFQSLRDSGDPVELALHYEQQGADEIVFLDIAATNEMRGTMLDVARRTAERLFIPLTIGGGIRSADDVAATLRAGADKVSINSAAVKRPELLTEAAERFGSQCVVISIDAKRNGDSWRVYTNGGRTSTELDAIEWAATAVACGAGEVLLTSIDRDGTKSGYDIELTRAIADRVDVPVIASGGAGGPMDVARAISEGHAEAALVAGILHDSASNVDALKLAIAHAGFPIRRSA
jgi:cyclase